MQVETEIAIKSWTTNAVKMESGGDCIPPGYGIPCSFCWHRSEDWNKHLAHLDNCLGIKRNRDRLIAAMEGSEGAS
jgi:hypothetical protein